MEIKFLYINFLILINSWGNNLKKRNKIGEKILNFQNR